MASTMKMVEKMGQIVPLKPVMRRWKTIRCLPRWRNLLSSWPEASSGSNDASHSSGWVSSSSSSHIPPGFFAVCVGSERDRFLIRTRFLDLPIFKSLLKKAEEDYGFNCRGGITLPCEVEFFGLVLKHLERDEHKFGRLELDDFLLKLEQVLRCNTTTSLKIDRLGKFPTQLTP